MIAYVICNLLARVAVGHAHAQLSGPPLAHRINRETCAWKRMAPIYVAAANNLAAPKNIFIIFSTSQYSKIISSKDDLTVPLHLASATLFKNILLVVA